MPTSKGPRTEDFLPEQLTLPHLVEAAAACRGCSLYLRATQTVFGEGPATARVVIVGEQPGDVEDRSGRPFVGPAGKLLDKALAEAGLDRSSVYLTNAVKHFSFEERGKQRLHKKPRQSEVHACRPWLEAELAVIRPDVLLLLGATASQAVFGPTFRISRERGRLLSSDLAPVVTATAHPSSILRAPDDEARAAAYRALVADLRVAAHALGQRPT
jgi:uracil-DNA glycosylase family protein